MKRYNSKRLKEEADCREVASFIGMRLSGRYCECVSGLHSETQINHCAIYRNRIHCFSCGDDQDVIGMVRSYYANVLGTPITYMEACRIIGDACGGHELYLEDQNDELPVKRVPFERSELALLKLDARQDSGTQHVKPLSMQVLFQTDETLFYSIVKEKAEEELDKLTRLEALLGKSAYEANLKAAIAERRQAIQAIYEKAGGPKRVKRLFDL